jgi:hypothetical protein
MTYPNADGVEIGPKLVVEARSHLYFIEFLERANRAAATESDDQVVELSNPREKILQLHGIACVYRMPGGSIADGGRSAHSLVRRASGDPDLCARAIQFSRRGQSDA